MDGLDFGFPTEVTGGSFAPPQIDIPSFNFPNFGADLNIGNLAGASGIGNLTNNLGDIIGKGVDMSGRGLDFTNPSSITDGGSAPSGGGGGGGWGLKDISGMARDVAPILGVGTTLAQIPLQVSALNQAGRNTKIAQEAATTAQRAAAPGIAASERLTPAGTDALLTGKLPPGLEAAVNEQVNQVRQQLLQHLVSQGIDPATANSMIEQQMAELRNTLTLQYAEGLLGGGSTTGGQAIQASQAAGAISGNLAGAEGASLQAANQALGHLVGSGG